MLAERHFRLYLWVRPRSLLLHLAFLIVGPGCLAAAWWQVNAAMQGNTLSYLYSVEWPAFAVVAAIGWWQLVHDTPEEIAERRAFHDRMRKASAEVVARTLPRSALAITVGSEELDAGSSRGLPAGSSRVLPAGSAPAAALVPAGSRSPVPAGARSPVPGDAGLEALLLSEEGDEGMEDEMTEYNRYLAYLALKGKPKTWRNPRGI